MPARYATRADVESLFPAVAAAIDPGPPDPLDDWLTATQPFLDVAVFGEKLMLAHIYFTLHALAYAFPSETGGEQGPIASLSAGPETISASFVAGNAISTLGTTQWGRLYQQLCAGVLAPYVVG